MCFCRSKVERTVLLQYRIDNAQSVDVPVYASLRVLVFEAVLFCESSRL